MREHNACAMFAFALYSNLGPSAWRLDYGGPCCWLPLQGDQSVCADLNRCNCRSRLRWLGSMTRI